MKLCYKFTAKREVRAEAYVMADNYDEAIKLAAGHYFEFGDFEYSVEGRDCDSLGGEISPIPERVSAEPAYGVLISRWDDEKKRWVAWEVCVNEDTNLYDQNFGTDYQLRMESVEVGRKNDRFGGFGIALCTHYCKVDGAVGEFDDVLDESGVVFTSCGDDIDSRLGVLEEFPKGDDVVYGQTDGTDLASFSRTWYKMERVKVRPTDRMVEFLVSRECLRWRLKDFN